MRKSSVPMMTVPAVGALLVGALLLGGLIPNTTDKFSETMKPTGYVTVSVVRDGNEIYHNEEHNLITDAGIDYIVAQLGQTGGINVAKYIALSTNVTGPTAPDTQLLPEINSGGLLRAAGNPTHAAGTDYWTVSNTFVATASFTGVQKAGLFTQLVGGTMMAENTFAPVNLANGDQLTITWTIDLGLKP